MGFNGFRAYQKVFSRSIVVSESQDSVVPDTLPDIAAIECSGGCVLIRSKDIAEGHVHLEANLPARICCVGEDGQRYCLDVNIPFYISAEDEAIRDDSICTAELTLLHLETRLLNPRKISARAEVRALLQCYAQEDVRFCTAPEASDGVIHSQERECTVTSVSDVTEKTFVLTDEYELPQERNAAAEILSQHADVLVQELKSVGSKLILKGVVRSLLIYRTESGALENIRFQTAFSQIIEAQTETEDALYEAIMLISGMYYELTPESDGRCISMELHLVAQVIVYQNRTVRFLSDAYSNGYAISIQREQRETVCFGREVLLRETLNAFFETAGEVASVIAVQATPTEWTQEGGSICIKLLVRLCWRSGETVCTASRSITKSIERDGEEEIRIVSACVQDVYASPGSGGAELHVSLELRGFQYRRMTLDCISAITFDETLPLDLDDRPTMVILYPGFSGDLWALAKDNCSTVEAICAANALTDGELPNDRILLIPKTI